MRPYAALFAGTLLLSARMMFFIPAASAEINQPILYGDSYLDVPSTIAVDALHLFCTETGGMGSSWKPFGWFQGNTEKCDLSNPGRMNQARDCCQKKYLAYVSNTTAIAIAFSEIALVLVVLTLLGFFLRKRLQKRV